MRNYRRSLVLAFWLLAALVCLSIGPPGVAEASFLFSHNEDASYATLVPADHELVNTDGVGAYALYGSPLTSLLPAQVNIDAVDLIEEDLLVFSLSEDVKIGGTVYADEDLLVWNGVSISLLWDGSANGLPARVNLDAVDVIAISPFEFSFSLEEDARLPVVGMVADEDMVHFTTGSGFSANLDFDGSAQGVPAQVDVNAFSRNTDTEWIFSFNSAARLNSTLYDDGDLIAYNTSGGTFSLYFDSSAQSIPEQVELDAMAFPTPAVTPTPTATPVTFVKEYTFDSNMEGWGFLPLAGSGFSGASSSYSGGRISVSSANDGTHRVGLWNSLTELAYVADNVYRATYEVSSDRASAAQNPQFRMRWLQDQSLESATQVVNASGSYSNSLPTDPTTKDYTCYFAPVVSGSLGVAFDMLDFNAAQYGTHYVDTVTVERFPFPALGTLVKTYASGGEFSNWGFTTNVGFGPVTSGGAGTGTLTITASTSADANYGWWQSSGSANELTYVADKLYRATYALRCASDVARNTMPQVRLRCQNDDAQMTATMELNSQGAGPGAMPTTGGTDYDVYFETPTLPGSPSTSEDGFIVTLDLLDFSSAQGGTIYMDSVMVDYLTIP